MSMFYYLLLHVHKGSTLLLLLIKMCHPFTAYMSTSLHRRKRRRIHNEVHNILIEWTTFILCFIFIHNTSYFMFQSHYWIAVIVLRVHYMKYSEHTLVNSLFQCVCLSFKSLIYKYTIQVLCSLITFM